MNTAAKILLAFLCVCILASLAACLSSCSLTENQKRLRTALRLMSGETTEFEKLTEYGE